jgi:uncharacterized protein
MSDEINFRWNIHKADTNLRKHGVSFSEALTVFADPLAIAIPDPGHSRGEERCLSIGLSRQRRLLVVAHAERDDEIRIINARLATNAERRNYEEG